jgi:thiamine monophosphate kinase
MSTAVGIENEENIVKRSGAKPNDLLVVSGDLGVPIWDFRSWKSMPFILPILICSRKWKGMTISWKDS